MRDSGPTQGEFSFREVVFKVSEEHMDRVEELRLKVCENVYIQGLFEAL